MAEEMTSQAPGEQAISQESKNMAMLLHILGIFGFFGPLVIWVGQKDTDKFVDEHGKAAMNYQISLLIYFLGAYLSFLILIGILLIPVLIVLHIILVIIAASKASRGQMYRYPIAIKFLK